MAENCIFCKIIAGEIPSTTVYEDEDFKAILDVNPAARGHVIILPKHHADDVFSLEDSQAEKIFPVAKKIATALKKTYQCDGVNILQNNGEAAYRKKFHNKECQILPSVFFQFHLLIRHNESHIPAFVIRESTQYWV